MDQDEGLGVTAKANPHPESVEGWQAGSIILTRTPHSTPVGAELSDSMAECSHHRFVEEGAAVAVLDLDDPQIRIILDLALEIGGGLFHLGRFSERARPDAFAVGAARLVEHGAGTVEPRNLDEDRARLFGALARDIGRRAGDLYATDERAHEYPGLETSGHGETLPRATRLTNWWNGLLVGPLAARNLAVR